MSYMHVARKEGQELVNHGYRRNVKEHVVGSFNHDRLGFSLGFHGVSQMPHSSYSIISYYKAFIFVPDAELLSDHEKIVSKLG